MTGKGKCSPCTQWDFPSAKKFEAIKFESELMELENLKVSEVISNLENQTPLCSLSNVDRFGSLWMCLFKLYCL